MGNPDQSTVNLFSPGMEQEKFENFVSSGDHVKFKDLVNCLVTRKKQKYDGVSLGDQVYFSKLFFQACELNQLRIATYIIECKELFLDVWLMLPDDTDEFGHNAFYYAIRSGDVNFIETLINKWPQSPFSRKNEKLEEILSLAYGELKLKNVTLSDQMETFIIDKLIKIRLFSKAIVNKQMNLDSTQNIKERIKIVIKNIEVLYKDYYFKKKAVDDGVLYILKFIAINIHILKQLLKSTYSVLPWEEMEFCLICFVVSYTKIQEINLFYNATLNKEKILNYLNHFSLELQKIWQESKNSKICQLASRSYVERDKVVRNIIEKNPIFKELYADYEQIRDISSLEKIADYLYLALSADSKEKFGQLIITRGFQAVGEYFQNTLESPKMSSSTCDHLLLSLPKNTAQLMKNIRHSLSHAGAFSIRSELEENADLNVFAGTQSDLQKIHCEVIGTINPRKLNILMTILQILQNNENIEKIKQTAAIMNNVKQDKMIRECPESLNTKELKELVKTFSEEIKDITDSELECFNEINFIFNSTNTNCNENIFVYYKDGFKSLKDLNLMSKEKDFDGSTSEMSYETRVKSLENISRITNANFKKISELAGVIVDSVAARKTPEDAQKIIELKDKICLLAENYISKNLDWVKVLEEKLSEAKSYLRNSNEQKDCLNHEILNKYLNRKTSELEKVLKCYNEVDPNNSSCIGQQALLAEMEMLVLDIMSIHEESNKCLKQNIFFLDDYTPILTGKSLRNHLAHDNSLVEVLPTDPKLATICNARNLNSKTLESLNRHIGKIVEDNPLKVKEKHNHNRLTIANQQNLFHSMETGNFENFINCLKKGGDIYAKSTDLSTSLHFAARGDSLEIVKYLTDRNLNVTAKDGNGQSPLHIAAAHGRCDIIEFLIREKNVKVSILDKLSRTPLHIAAKYGVKESVDILTKYNADANIRDDKGFSPLGYAVFKNHKEIAKELFNPRSSFNFNETLHNISKLQLASKQGHIELVNYFLEKGADVNAADDNGCTALYYAVEAGRADIVQTLLSHKAWVNIKKKTTYITPLHSACKNGFHQIVKDLLKHGACVNDIDRDGHTPLHIATRFGHHQIIQTLLMNNADISAKDNLNGDTALHLAAESGFKEITELLLKNGADVKAQENAGKVPLHFAARGGNYEVINLFLNDGIDVNVKATDGTTPLHEACFHSQVKAVELLLENKAEINAQDNVGYTPVKAAAKVGSKEIVELFNLFQEKLFLKRDNGAIPLHLPALNGHSEIVNTLSQKADVNAAHNED